MTARCGRLGADGLAMALLDALTAEDRNATLRQITDDATLHAQRRVMAMFSRPSAHHTTLVGLDDATRFGTDVEDESPSTVYHQLSWGYPLSALTISETAEFHPELVESTEPLPQPRRRVAPSEAFGRRSDVTA